MPTKRTVGVIASGVVAILGSLMTILGGVSMVGGAMLSHFNPQLYSPPGGTPTPPFDVSVILFGEGLFFLAVGAFGVIAAIGLLRLKNWARISFLIFAALLCLFSISTIGVSVLMLVVGPQVPMPPEAPENILAATFAILLFISLAVTALAIWWLFYFTRRKVKEQFLGEEAAALPFRGPISVTIIAWILVVGGLLSFLALLLPYPMMLFGFAFSGWAGRIVVVCFGAMSLIAGAGILRWNPRALALAVAIYAFSFINLLSYAVIPGAMERMRTMMREQYAANGAFPYPESFIWFGLVMGALAVVVPLWFLLTRRRKFLEACEPQGPAVQL